jgi:hypothetical protein
LSRQARDKHKETQHGQNLCVSVGTNVWLYRGTKDACYLKGSVEHSQTFFNKLGANVAVNFTTPSAHSWPTLSYGTPCGQGVIENCDYDGPGAALQHIYDRCDAKTRISFRDTPFDSY